MLAIDFLNKDICAQVKIFDELLLEYGKTSLGSYTFPKWIAICKNNKAEQIHCLMKDWGSTTRFEGMLLPFIYKLE